MSWFNATVNALRTYWWSNGYQSNSTTAYQGAWDNGTRRIGVLCFSGMNTALKDTTISSIQLRLYAGGSGWGSHTAVNVGFWGAHSSYANACTNGVNRSYWLNTSLGYNASLGWFNSWNNLTLSSSANSSLFTKMATYLSQGRNNIILYRDEVTAQSGYSFSPNYKGFTNAAINVQYEKGGVRICTDATNGTWKLAIPYICTDATNGTWKQAIPYVCTDATNGTWKVTA